MLKLTIDGQNYKIRFSTLVIADSDIITKILEDTQNRIKVAVSTEARRADLIKKVETASKNGDPNINDTIDSAEAIAMDMYKALYDSAIESMRITAELLAAGLQKYHKDEFGYYIDDPDNPDALPIVDESLKSKAIRKCYDLIDSYEDDATEEQLEKGEHDAMELYGLLNQELERNGFLSQISRSMTGTDEEVQTKNEPTVIPMDHQKKRRSRKATKSES